MSDAYTEYKFSVAPAVPGMEILLAQLSEVGFESFKETDFALFAYIPTEKKIDLENVPLLASEDFTIDYETKIIVQQDWNTKWENQFKPVVIGNNCRIRASYHAPKKELDYDIVINPKMAFGTGHHPTTHLMTLFLLEEEVTDKTILDMGCGTGVLSILASKKKAAHIDAIDIDSWCYENTKENASLNNCTNISVLKGDSHSLKNKYFDIIFANINRNVLLTDMEIYANCLPADGLLYLSGFYITDLPKIKKRAQAFGLVYQNHKFKEEWIAVRFLKRSQA